MMEGVCVERCRVESGFLGSDVSLLGWEKSTEKVKLRVSENIVCLVVGGKAKGKWFCQPRCLSEKMYRH